jgi:dipeptidyl aminopeptidase/acylaminoacyl peptidase
MKPHACYVICMHTAAYGTWLSPLTPELVAQGLVRYAFAERTPDGALYWTEQRAAEQGRNVVVRHAPDGTSVDLLPPPYSARTRVHEYGGRSFQLGAGQLFFVHQADQQVHQRQTDGAFRPLTAAADTRFAELVYDSRRQRLVAVAERHTADGRVDNFVTTVPLHAGTTAPLTQASPLIQGHDFYASPTLSPDGSRLAYLAWSHPHMPWDAAALYVATLAADGSVERSEHIAGSAGGSALQPTWSPSADSPADLYFALESEGAWALHRWRAQAGEVELVVRTPGELGAPLWQLGARLWDIVDAHRVVAVTFEAGQSRLIEIDVERRQARTISADFPYVGHLSADARDIYLTLGWAGAGSEIVRIERATTRVTTVRCAHSQLLEAEDTSLPEAIQFETTGGEAAHGFFYAPKNQRFCAASTARPPLVVLVHGGPTAGASATFSPTAQYFTTRGFAVLDVNYRGSSGYGRAYRDRLRGQWGIVDVDDCVAGAQHLARLGRVDPERLVIRGGSAGGYSVLQALANHDVFAAGSCHYGVSDLEALTRDTHKFESHYDRFLVGPYPERRDLFVERSPIHYVERIRKPVIFFQGLEDRVVPPNQTERMAQSLRERGITSEYHAYPGEQHGFRKATTIEHVLSSELAFLQRVLAL